MSGKTPNFTPSPIKQKGTWFEDLICEIRLHKVLPSIKAFKNPRVLDVGCGFEARLLRAIEPYIAKGVGIDFKAPQIHSQKLQTLSYFFEEKAKFEPNFAQNLAKTGGGERPRFA